ncbi:NAD(P)/FAD-dependent oxidoreductase [Sulfolobus tengchongensis]|uniref:NAD(P)/FAD-dependent oxidoreductase n=1 Tax=Sulfolobus tengchongensis TaxID=207809 RepID=A0AAX4KWI7_9CREN
MKFDVVVVGAGPAGSSAALTAARGGAKVLLLERGPEPGSKNVSGAMIRLEDFSSIYDISSIPIERKVKNVDLILLSDSNRVRINVNVESNLATAGRLKLDKWMAQQAEKAGALLITKTTVLGIERESDGYKVITDRGEIGADRIVLAEGVNALVSIKANIRPDLTPEQTVQAVKEVYSLNKDEVNKRFGFKADDEGASWRILGTDPVPYAGFLYVYKDAIAIGVGVPMKILIKRKVTPYTVLDEVKERLGLNELIKGSSLREYSAKIIPEYGFPSWKGCSGKVYLAGDSLGLVDPLTFNGIGPAVASGTLAGKAALETYECSRYETELMKNREIKRVVNARPLVKELVEEENFKYYVKTINDLLHGWVYSDFSKVKLDTSKLLKHLILGMGVLKS